MTQPTLKEALILAAYLVELHGEGAVPIMDRLEREVLAARKVASGRDLSRQMLNRMSVEITPSAAATQVTTRDQGR